MTASQGQQPLTIGQRIHEVRRARRLTQREVARRTGIVEPFLSRIENNHAQPSVSTLERLAEAMGVTLGDLLAVEPARFKPPCPVSQSGRCIAELIYQPGPRAPSTDERYTPRQVRLLRLATYLAQNGTRETFAALETVMQAMEKGTPKQSRAASLSAKPRSG
jgi:transcriptional regulator with XRE-family HTH domain